MIKRQQRYIRKNVCIRIRLHVHSPCFLPPVLHFVCDEAGWLICFSCLPSSITTFETASTSFSHRAATPRFHLRYLFEGIYFPLTQISREDTPPERFLNTVEKYFKDCKHKAADLLPGKGTLTHYNLSSCCLSAT